MRSLIKKILRESEDDGLGWIRDTRPSTIDFFQVGREYDMYRLKSGVRNYRGIRFDGHRDAQTGYSYDDGRGLLYFGSHAFTPLYIETRLTELGLTLYDLEINPRLNESIIIEGRVEDMKKKYPEHESVIDYFVSNDPSGNNKYLPWMMKQLVTNSDDQGIIVSVIKRFHDNQQRLEKKDINQYKTTTEVVESLTKIGKSKSEERKQTRLEGAKVVYEDDNVIALRPLNHKASCTYGAGTKWCVTMKTTDKYWNNYTRKTSNFNGTNWYESEWVEEEIEPNFVQKMLGQKPKKVKREIKHFIEQFPVGILYFVIFKRRITGYDWDEEIQARIPKYVKADPNNPMNKLALLYRPDRADFGDMSWSEWARQGDFMSMLGDRLDAAHNNLSIFNTLDRKVTLREVSREFDEEFSVPFRFIENDFQNERNVILSSLSNVLDKVLPLAGGEGSKNPRYWITGTDGELHHVVPSNTRKFKNEKGYNTLTFNASGQYKKSHW